MLKQRLVKKLKQVGWFIHSLGRNSGLLYMLKGPALTPTVLRCLTSSKSGLLKWSPSTRIQGTACLDTGGLPGERVSGRHGRWRGLAARLVSWACDSGSPTGFCLQRKA